MCATGGVDLGGEGILGHQLEVVGWSRARDVWVLANDWPEIGSPWGCWPTIFLL